MKPSLMATRVAPLVLLLSCMRSFAMAGDAQRLKLIKMCPMPGTQEKDLDFHIKHLAVYPRGDTDVIVAIPYSNIRQCHLPPGVWPRETIVLAKWDRKKAELSLLHRFDDLPFGICDPITTDGESVMFGVYGIGWEPPPVRFASAYVVNRGGNLVRLKAPEDVEYQVAISPDGRLIAWVCRGGRIRIRSASSNQDLFTFVSDTGKVGALVFSNDGRMISMETSPKAGFERTLLLDLRGNLVLGTLTDPRREWSWTGRCFSALGNAYGVATENGYLIVCNMNTGSATTISNPREHSHGVLALSSDARLVISGGWTEAGPRQPLLPIFRPVGIRPDVIGEIKVWDCLTGKVVKSAHEPRLGEIKSLALSSDDRLLFVGDDKGQIGIFDLDPISPGTGPLGPAG